MGQMTFAVMWGCPMPEAPEGKSWWSDGEEVNGKWVETDGLLDDIYEPGDGLRKPETDENGDVIGVIIALGASGRLGHPYLEGPIDLTGFEQDERYADSLTTARKSWEHWAAFCVEQGVTLPAARLYLVETEVA